MIHQTKGRNIMKNCIDLHAHTTFSDGTFTPTELVQKAKDVGLSAIAITDHNCILGNEEAEAVGKKIGVEVIHGVELSASYDEIGLHILGFFVDSRNKELNEKLKTLRDASIDRNRKIFDKLRSLGLDVSYEELLALSGTQMHGKYHISQYLVSKGIVDSVKDAMELYLKKGKVAYVERSVKKLTSAEGINLIHASGGIAVLAHPIHYKSLNIKALEKLVFTLREQGLDGIEVYHSDHSSFATNAFLCLAKEYGLYVTGGSDFHYETIPHFSLGKGYGGLNIPYSVLELLYTKIGGA